MLITFPFYLKNKIRIDCDAKNNPKIAKEKVDMLRIARAQQEIVLESFNRGIASMIFVDYDGSRFLERDLEIYMKNRHEIQRREVELLEMINRELEKSTA